jgi:hypothetical protein
MQCGGGAAPALGWSMCLHMAEAVRRLGAERLLAALSAPIATVCLLASDWSVEAREVGDHLRPQSRPGRSSVVE